MKNTIASLMTATLLSAAYCAAAFALDETGIAPEGTIADAVGNIKYANGAGDGQGDCTGTAIAPHWAITARHCIDGLADTSGEFVLGYKQRSFAFDFSEPAPSQDIALMHFKEDLGLKQYPTLGNALKVGESGSFYGWSSKGIGKTGKLPVAEATVSDVAGHPLYGEGTAMHVSLAGKAVTQPGDSGGPLMKDDQVVGVASVALSNGGEQSNTAAIVPVDGQREWIEQRIATPENEVQPPSDEELQARGVDTAATQDPRADLPTFTIWLTLAVLVIVAAVFYRLRAWALVGAHPRSYKPSQLRFPPKAE